MRNQTRLIAALELALIFPAAIFMTALAGRNLQPQQYELAQRIVMWYSARMWTLWVLLLALPLAVLFMGCATMLHVWNRNAELPNTPRPSFAGMILEHPAALFLAATTLTAAGILAIVILHMLVN